jgi:hypothetical protein
VPIAGSAAQDYKAYADTNGQTHVDVTSLCTFKVTDSALGAFAAAHFASNPRGGDTTVTATCGGTQGSTSLHLILAGWILATGAPQNSPTLFANATTGIDPQHTPAVEYPLDKAVAPLNIPSIDSQWTTAQNDLFHLTWTSKHIAIELYTLQADAQFADDIWSNVAASASGDAVSVAVEGLAQGSPSTKYASAPVTLNMSHDVIDNTAIYWWASSQGNLMTQTFGQSGAPSVVKNDCTSCHSVSRSGSRIGYSRCVNGDCNQLFAGFMKYDTTNKVWTDTLSANTAQQEGGGIFNSSSASLWNVTLSNNSAAAGGALFSGSIASSVLTNTILAYSPTGGNCSGALTASKYSLSSDNSCALSGLVHGQDPNGLDPLLTALGNYGGPTLVHMLKLGSPAIAGVVGSDAPATDQRGQPRPGSDGSYDIGAVERQPADSDLAPRLYLPQVAR